MPGTRRLLGGPVSPRPYLEQVKIPIYDSVSVPTASREIAFFGTPLGGADAGAVNGATKTLSDTNIEQANALATPKTFDIEGISVKYPPAVPIADLKEFLREGELELFVGAKTYLRVPLMAIPQDVGVTGPGDHHIIDAGAVTVVDYLTNGAPVHKNIFDVRVQEEVGDPKTGASVLTGNLVPIHLPSQQFFSLTVRFPGTLTLSATTRVFVYLWGVLKREVH